MIYDTAEEDLQKVLKWYMVETFKYVANNDGVSSREAWQHVKEIGDISRASIINGMNDLVDWGVFTYEETTGKGGYRRIYYTDMNEKGLKIWVIRKLLEDLLQFYPESEMLQDINRNWLTIQQ